MVSGRWCKQPAKGGGEGGVGPVFLSKPLSYAKKTIVSHTLSKISIENG